MTIQTRFPFSVHRAYYFSYDVLKPMFNMCLYFVRNFNLIYTLNVWFSCAFICNGCVKMPLILWMPSRWRICVKANANERKQAENEQSTECLMAMTMIWYSEMVATQQRQTMFGHKTCVYLVTKQSTNALVNHRLMTKLKLMREFRLLWWWRAYCLYPRMSFISIVKFLLTSLCTWDHSEIQHRQHEYNEINFMTMIICTSCVAYGNKHTSIPALV